MTRVLPANVNRYFFSAFLFCTLMLLLNCSGGSSGGDGAAGGVRGPQVPQKCDYYCTNFLQEFDNDASGDVDKSDSYFYTYIAGDRVTGFIEYDNDGDLSTDVEIEVSYKNDFVNNELTIVERRQYITAGAPDDVITTIWALDADGRRESGEIATDTGDDGSIEVRTWITYTYDAFGAVLTEDADIDNGDNGSIDSEYSRTFTPTYDNGKILTNRIEYDSDGDLTVDEIRTVTNNYVGGLRVSKVVMIDSNADSFDDAQQDSTYSHDANGNEIEEEVEEDSDLNLTTDSTWTNTWAYSKICSDTLSEPLNPLDWPI